MCITESPTPVVATANLHWYALRVFHHRTSEVMERLHDDGWRTYVAMRREENVDIHYNDSRVKDVPVIPSLIFLQAPHDYVLSIYRSPVAPMRPYCPPGTSVPAIIPDAEMNTFIYVTSHCMERMDMVNPNLIKGDRVRVTEGIFRDQEGYILRVHGTKRFVVVIEGVAAVATSFIPGRFLQKLPPHS